MHHQCQCQCNSLHQRAPALLTLFIIPFLFLFAQCHPWSPLHAFHRHVLLACSVLPSEPLNRASVGSVNADCPFAAAHLDTGVVAREMELRKEDLCRHSFRCGYLAVERKRESGITQVKAIGADLSHSSDRARAHVCFGSSEPGRASDVWRSLRTLRYYGRGFETVFQVFGRCW